MDLWNDLGFSLCAVLSVCHVVATSDEGEKSELVIGHEGGAWTSYNVVAQTKTV